MKDRFDLFRFSLLPRVQVDAFEEPPNPTREQYLRQVFGKPWPFSHYGHHLHYTPRVGSKPGEALFGMIGRNLLIEENLPPEEGLLDSPHSGWRALVLIIDPKEHEDGQKAAIEVNREIGGPVALVHALTKAINAANPHTAFLIEAQPMFDAETFWDFAEANRGEITSLTFDLVVPNGLWSASKNLKRELRKLGTDTRTEEVSTTFRSRGGIETNAEQIKEVVKYAEGGSGKIRASTRAGRKFNSTERPKSVTLDTNRAATEPLILRVAKNLAKIFGRE